MYKAITTKIKTTKSGVVKITSSDGENTATCEIDDYDMPLSVEDRLESHRFGLADFCSRFCAQNIYVGGRLAGGMVWIPEDPHSPRLDENIYKAVLTVDSIMANSDLEHVDLVLAYIEEIANKPWLHEKTRSFLRKLHALLDTKWQQCKAK